MQGTMVLQLFVFPVFPQEEMIDTTEESPISRRRKIQQKNATGALSELPYLSIVPCTLLN